MTASNPTFVSGLLGTDFSWSGVMRTDKLTWLSRALSLTGFAIAAYLTTVYLQDLPPACFGGSTGCATVQHSSYAHLAGIPLPLFGLVGYALLFVSACLPGQRARTAGMVFTVVAVECERRTHVPGAERHSCDLLLVRRVGGLRDPPCDRQFGPVRAGRAVNRLASSDKERC